MICSSLLRWTSTLMLLTSLAACSPAGDGNRTPPPAKSAALAPIPAAHADELAQLADRPITLAAVTAPAGWRFTQPIPNDRARIVAYAGRPVSELPPLYVTPVTFTTAER
jgi:hypothetical protein